MIHSSERSTKEYREFLIKLGACPECMSIPEHHIDEPFATCGCCTSENYAKSPLMQAQLMRAALEEMADTNEMLLEALVSIQAWVTDGGFEDTHEGVAEICGQARAAIAKAHGETQ